MSSVHRIQTKPLDSRNANIYLQYALDEAAWIWHPDFLGLEDCSMVEFSLSFELEKPLALDCQISADNRFELYLDGAYCAMGPDRCDVDHWAFSTLHMEFTAGRHELRARCWYYSLKSLVTPRAQIGCRPGFIFGAVQKECRDMFNTGKGDWKVREIKGLSYQPGLGFTGMGCITSLKTMFTEAETVTPAVVMAPRANFIWGAKAPNWRLSPSNLPEQLRVRYPEKQIRVRAILDSVAFGQENLIAKSTCEPNGMMEKWQKFFHDENSPLTLPAHTHLGVLLDLGDYVCAYPVLTAAGSEYASIRIMWAEALHRPGNETDKGNRAEIEGKAFPAVPQWDEFREFEEIPRICSVPWWRAGRFVLLAISTGEKPLTLNALHFDESRYPFKAESTISLHEPLLDDLQPILLRTMQMCMHETYIDCPYYEQLMYVADTRLECMTGYVLQQDAELSRRAMHVFDWSRSLWGGLASEHYPGCEPQLSSTFSSIWPMMIRDFLMYRGFEDGKEFTGLRNGVRAMLHALSDYVNEEGLVEGLPGWSFVDWIAAWGRTGVPAPFTDGGKSSIFSLYYLMSLKTAIALEAYLPEEDGGLSAYWRSCFARTAAAVKKTFWRPDLSLFMDDVSGEHFSMHAQCLALLADVIEGEEARRCYDAMLARKGITVPTVSWIYYLFDTFAKFGEGYRLLDYANIWTDMKEKGSVTVWEAPEPTRSDCHAWSSHLFYHYFATIAGIRSVSPAFRTVRIAPSLGRLEHVDGRMVHPQGEIVFDIRREGDRLAGTIRLPRGVTGMLLCNGTEQALAEGENTI